MSNEQRLAQRILANQDNYFCWASRPATIQRISPLVRPWYKQFGTSIINFRDHNSDISYYFEKDKYRQMGLSLVRKFYSEKLIKKHLADYQAFSRELLNVGQRAKKVQARPRDLLKLFISCEKALGDFSYFLVTTFGIDDHVFPELCRQLQKILPERDYDIAVKIVSSPTRVFGYQRYQLALIKARRAKDWLDLVEQYRWIKEYSFKEKLLDLAAARRDKREIIKAGLTADLLKTAANYRRNQLELERLLKKIKDSRWRALARLANSYVNIKTERIEVYKMFQANFREFFKKLLVVIQQDFPTAKYEDMISLTDDEIISYLRNGRLPDWPLVRKRFANQYVSVSFRGKIAFIYDPKLINQVRRAFLEVKDLVEIKGKVVSRGRAQGRVKLIINKADLNKLKTGQVLVSNFTTPEYVPAMKRAVAIITDDGGITSHAAIIARELKKPCVVGTKVATKFLKDGDLVEVDASQGIVRIIK